MRRQTCFASQGLPSHSVSTFDACHSMALPTLCACWWLLTNAKRAAVAYFDLCARLGSLDSRRCLNLWLGSGSLTIPVTLRKQACFRSAQAGKVCGYFQVLETMRFRGPSKHSYRTVHSTFYLLTVFGFVYGQRQGHLQNHCPWKVSSQSRAPQWATQSCLGY